MAVPSHDDSELKPLQGERIAFVGKLAGMARREASELVTARGAELVSDESHPATLVVIGDSQPDLDSAFESDKTAPRQWAEDVAAGRATLLRESELWKRIGLVDEEQGVQRLYTPAMLAELLDVPPTAVRRWHRSGVLVACRNVRRLPYFDFTEVAVARHAPPRRNPPGRPAGVRSGAHSSGCRPTGRDPAGRRRGPQIPRGPDLTPCVHNAHCALRSHERE